jgi:hypothetical protein
MCCKNSEIRLYRFIIRRTIMEKEKQPPEIKLAEKVKAAG